MKIVKYTISQTSRLVCVVVSRVLQRFSNNDHLAVHRQKHEFSLKFGGTSKTGEALLVGE